MTAGVWWTDDPKMRMLFSVAGSTGIRGLSSYFFAPKLLLGADGLKALEGVAPTLTRSKKALIVTDKTVRKLAERVQAALQRAGLTAEIWDGVIPEPPLENIQAGAEEAGRLEADLLVAVGGGSVMDATKAIWLNYARPELDIRQVKPVDPDTLAVVPLGVRSRAAMVCIPTTSGTGSETTATAVITDGSQKKILNHPELVPDLAILDPSFTAGVPPKLTAYTGMDVLAHATGSVLSHWSNEYTVPLGYQAISLVFKYLPRAVQNGADSEARYKMAVASNMAGMSFGNAAPGIEHAMGHAFGKIFGVHHGCAVGIFTPYMMQYVSRHSERFLDLARHLGVTGADGREIMDNLLELYLSFMRSVGCPCTIEELGITRKQLDENFEPLLDYTVSDACTLMSIRPVTRENYRKLYLCAYSGEKVDF
ncbi:MAG: iron-containing alcohol dehydrogenase [Peptococcaceae bacterium]|nr:iron-containing alcohol dehydrogenase [Peptococcaceae bacterium]